MRDRLGRGETAPVWLLLAGAMSASAALLLFWGSKLTFLLDDWEFLLYRPGFTAHSILSPHGEHISIAPILIYKALLATVGMDSSAPYLSVSIVLFLGPAFGDLLCDFQMGFNGSLVCGLGALLMLERGDGRGDVMACALLSLGVTFSSLSLPFIAAACVDVLLRSGRPRRLYVIGVPALLYAIWWVGWGHEADTAISLHNAAATPQL